MSTGKKVFIVGPGFIGWEVLELLIKEKYSVTGLVRRDAHAAGIEASGATAVKGELDDAEIITHQTAEHDVVLHMATADHLPSAKAVLEGVRQRANKGLSTIYIHTSGTSVLDDGSAGDTKTDRVYSDHTRHDVDTVPDDAIHRPIDLEIVRVQNELKEKAKIAIMLPPLIYGCKPPLWLPVKTTPIAR